MTSPALSTSAKPSIPVEGLASAAAEYTIDLAQRTTLFWDVMRQAGNQYRAHADRTVPHLLKFDTELILDGRTLERPVNYALLRIVPPDGMKIDPKLRPFVVVDPRAGHRPGIGGFKADSEIGVALEAGHTCYFVGFLPEPVPGQTLEHVARAEAEFLRVVIGRHPEAEGKPCVIGNCQAGWAVMMLASLEPELFGPIIVAGSPLSYWTGEPGLNPMRYSGGLLGGSWLTALTSDLGGGRFDGAWLVQNFENLNPANTFWTKPHNLLAGVDTEASRYLGFERWWGGYSMLNAEEIQFIVDNLFIGNKLAAGEIKTSNGMAVDLRNIRSPIVVFCSKGDNITPPQQALGWILDLYDDVDEIRSYGQTIVYAVHPDAGHLGVFVSSSVARKEYDEFASNIDLIDMLPPGLYEAVFEAKNADTEDPDLVNGEWVMRCEERTLDDIRALGGNTREDDRCFAAAARMSEVNLALYRAFAQPFVRAMVSASAAEWVRNLHPLRLKYELCSDANPLMVPFAALAESMRDHRRPARKANPCLATEASVSRQMVAMLDAWRDARDSLCEAAFRTVYGSPVVQALYGVDPASTSAARKAGKSALHAELVDRRIAELKARVAVGGVLEATVRALVYVVMSHAAVDERAFESVRRLRKTWPEATGLGLADFKALVRDQLFILLIEPQAALDAIPALLANAAGSRRGALAIVREVLAVNGELTDEAGARLKRIVRLFDAETPARAA